MRRNLDPLPFDAEIANIPCNEFVEQFQQAYRDGDRERFILLGQRLAWTVTCNTIRAQRLAAYRLDMFSVGVLALIEQFDRQPAKALDMPYAYFRRVVYYQILQFLYWQGVLIRKGAKRQRLLYFDTDLSGRDDDGPSIVERAPARELSRELSLAETIDLCLQAAVDPRRSECKRRTPATVEFDPTVTATPAQLRAKGMTWKAIGQLIGVGVGAVATQPHKTPEQLRRQREVAKQQREIGRLRDAGELECKSWRCEETIPRGPRARQLGTKLAFDPTITATPKELRQQGYTWQEIADLLGISITAAHNAAHKAPHKTPEQLREQARVSAQRRKAAARRCAAAA
jgi:hypothetical protein